MHLPKKISRKMETPFIEMLARFREIHKQKAGVVKRATKRDKREFYHHKAEDVTRLDNPINERCLRSRRSSGKHKRPKIESSRTRIEIN